MKNKTGGRNMKTWTKRTIAVCLLLALFLTAIPCASAKQYTDVTRSALPDYFDAINCYRQWDHERRVHKLLLPKRNGDARHVHHNALPLCRFPIQLCRSVLHRHLIKSLCLQCGKVGREIQHCNRHDHNDVFTG